MNTHQMCLEKIQQEVKLTPSEYLPALLNIIHSFRESVALDSAKESFKAGWDDLQNGRYQPISTLWDDIEK